MARLTALTATGMAAAWLALLAAPGMAQDVRAHGNLTARSYAPLTPGAPITVEAAQDTDQYQRLKAAIEQSLRANGYQVAADGQLILEFYASEVLGGGPVEKQTGARTQQGLVRGTEPPYRTGILDKLNNSLFSGEVAQPSKEGEPPPPRQVHLSMTLTDWNASRRIWQGSASGDMQRADTYASTQALVPFLVSKLGTTISGERFDLP
jgi:hypothetical protein